MQDGTGLPQPGVEQEMDTVAIQLAMEALMPKDTVRAHGKAARGPRRLHFRAAAGHRFPATPPQLACPLLLLA